jgi:hypothetical protein
MYYQIGKDIGIRYMLLSKSKKIPALLIKPTINYLSEVFKSAGLSVAENVRFHNINYFTLKGKNNIICRISKESSVFSGLISGVVSSLTNTNIEASSDCKDCPNHCCIIVNNQFKEKYIPNIEELIPSRNYDLLNFPKKIISSENRKSFSDFLKFKKVIITDVGKFSFNNLNIIPLEIGWTGLLYHHYSKIGHLDIFEESIVNSSKKISKIIFSNCKNTESLIILENLLCAFGWGIPYVKKIENKIIFKFLYPPQSKYGFTYHALVLKGFMEYIFNRKFIIEKTNTKKTPPIIEITFR